MADVDIESSERESGWRNLLALVLERKRIYMDEENALYRRETELTTVEFVNISGKLHLHTSNIRPASIVRCASLHRVRSWSDTLHVCT